MIHLESKKDGRAFSADVKALEYEPGTTTSKWHGVRMPERVHTMRIGVWLEGLELFFRIRGDLARDMSSDGSELVFDRGQRVRFTEVVDRYPHILIEAGVMGTIESDYNPGQGDFSTHVFPDDSSREGKRDDEWNGCFVLTPYDEGEFASIPPFEHVSEHVLSIGSLMKGEQPVVTSAARLAPDIRIEIDEKTRQQILVWWDQHMESH